MAGLAKSKIVVVCGPTASGKTDMAVALCRALGGEMVGADSMQVYNGLPVGTAALRPEQAPDVSRHLIGFLAPEQHFSVAEYLPIATKAIAEIQGRGKVPVVCGGTGLYITSLVNGITFTEEKPSSVARDELESLWQREGGPAMLERLHRVDPSHAEILPPADKRRILRSLEEFALTGRTHAQRIEASRTAPPAYEALLLAPIVEPRAELYLAIDERVEQMMAAGLLEEARRVYENQSRYQGVRQAIGYKEFFPYFSGEEQLEACVAQLKQATRKYAKRQLTWFRGMDNIHWLSGNQKEQIRKAQDLATQFTQEGGAGR